MAEQIGKLGGGEEEGKKEKIIDMLEQRILRAKDEVRDEILTMIKRENLTEKEIEEYLKEHDDLVTVERLILEDRIDLINDNRVDLIKKHIEELHKPFDPEKIKEKWIEWVQKELKCSLEKAKKFIDRKIIIDYDKEEVFFGGDFDISGAQAKELPEGLEFGGNLFIKGTQITELPEGLKVGGYLYLKDTQITKLPEELEIGRGLGFGGSTQIKELPKGLKLGGYLDLKGTQIAELPEGLKVGGALDIKGTQIKELPEGLDVGGDLFTNSFISKEQIEKLKKEGKIKIKGDIYPR